MKLGDSFCFTAVAIIVLVSSLRPVICHSLDAYYSEDLRFSTESDENDDSQPLIPTDYTIKYQKPSTDLGNTTTFTSSVSIRVKCVLDTNNIVLYAKDLDLLPESVQVVLLLLLF